MEKGYYHLVGIDIYSELERINDIKDEQELFSRLVALYNYLLHHDVEIMKRKDEFEHIMDALEHLDKFDDERTWQLNDLYQSVLHKYKQQM
jgi:flagellin-specific chaperone FliS